MNPIIKTENLTHTYGVGTPFEHTAIENVDFEAYKGEFMGIIGHTGSGKSTFIQHLNGLIAPTSGKVFFDGEDIFASKETTRSTRFKVGLVFQYPEYQLFEDTVYKDIAFGPKNMKLTEAEIDERVRWAADLTGIDEQMLDKSPFELSGGQKRRAAIAGVIAMRPQVLILDEPTAGLDPQGRDEVMGNIRAFHDSMDDIARTVDRLVVFDNSHIVMRGMPKEVFSHADELTKIGLSVPKVTMVAMRLRQMGLNIAKDIYTVEQLCAELNKLKEGMA